jgi:hypothetical protein
VPIGKNASAFENDPGFEPKGTLRSLERRGARNSPALSLNSARAALRRAHADESAITRARIASSFWAMRRAGAARIHQDYAAKIAAARLCARPDQVGAAVEALCQEREAALEAFQRTTHADELALRTREIGALRARHRQEWKALSRPRLIGPISGSGGALERFRRQGRRMTKRAARTRRYSVRRIARRPNSMPGVGRMRTAPRP